MCENSRLPRFSMCLSPEEFYFLQAGDLPSQFYDIFLACQFPDHRSIRNLNPRSTLQNWGFQHLFPNLLFLLISCQSTTVTKKVIQYHSECLTFPYSLIHICEFYGFYLLAFSGIHLLPSTCNATNLVFKSHT